jgi:hypothetical protein
MSTAIAFSAWPTAIAVPVAPLRPIECPAPFQKFRPKDGAAKGKKRAACIHQTEKWPCEAYAILLKGIAKQLAADSSQPAPFWCRPGYVASIGPRHKRMCGCRPIEDFS